MKNTTRTLYGAALLSAKTLGVPHVIVPKTTLNEKFQIAEAMLPEASASPSVRYYGIGRGGHDYQKDTEGDSYNRVVDHSPTDASLYKPMPFVLRPVENDLTAEQRAKYRMRRQETHFGRNYYAYYLKELVLGEDPIEMTITVVVDGQEITKPFIPDSSNLNPTPPAIPPTGSTPSSTAYGSVIRPLSIEFNEFDVAELLAAANVLFEGNLSKAIISEIALVHGVDTLLTGKTTGGANIQYKEVIGAQVNAFFSSLHDISANNEGFIKDLDLGDNEPMLTGTAMTIVNGAQGVPRTVAV